VSDLEAEPAAPPPPPPRASAIARWPAIAFLILAPAWAVPQNYVGDYRSDVAGAATQELLGIAIPFMLAGLLMIAATADVRAGRSPWHLVGWVASSYVFTELAWQFVIAPGPDAHAFWSAMGDATLPIALLGALALALEAVKFLRQKRTGADA
jgi:hypothetical protein